MNETGRQPGMQTIDDLSMFIRILCHKLKQKEPEAAVLARVTEYMKAKGLWSVSDVLRVETKDDT